MPNWTLLPFSFPLTAALAAAVAGAASCTFTVSPDVSARPGAPTRCEADLAAASPSVADITPLPITELQWSIEVPVGIEHVAALLRAMGKIDAACALWGTLADTLPDADGRVSTENMRQHCPGAAEAYAAGHRAMGAQGRCGDDDDDALAACEGIQGICCEKLFIKAQYNRLNSQGDAEAIARWTGVANRLARFGCIGGVAYSCADAAVLAPAGGGDPAVAEAFFRRHACRLGDPKSCDALAQTEGAAAP